MSFKDHFKQWEQWEDDLLEIHYNKKPLAWLMQKFGRTDLDIRTRAHILNVKGVYAKEKKIVKKQEVEPPKQTVKRPPTQYTNIKSDYLKDYGE